MSSARYPKDAFEAIRQSNAPALAYFIRQDKRAILFPAGDLPLEHAIELSRLNCVSLLLNRYELSHEKLSDNAIIRILRLIKTKPLDDLSLETVAAKLTIAERVDSLIRLAKEKPVTAEVKHHEQKTSTNPTKKKPHKKKKKQIETDSPTRESECETPEEKISAPKPKYDLDTIKKIIEKDSLSARPLNLDTAAEKILEILGDKEINKETNALIIGQLTYTSKTSSCCSRLWGAPRKVFYIDEDVLEELSEKIHTGFEIKKRN